MTVVTESWSGADSSTISRDQTWTEYGTDWEVVSNWLTAPVTGEGVARLDIDLGTEHYAEVDVVVASSTGSTSGFAGPAVRVSSDGQSYYFFGSHNGQNSFGRQLRRVVGGSSTRIDTRIDGNIADCRLRLDVFDDGDGNPVLTCYVDGVEVYTHVDTHVNKITGNQRAGVARIAGTDGAAHTFANFEAGDAGRPPIGTYYQGAVTSDAVTIAVEVRDTHDLRIAYATDENMTSPAYTSTFADQTGPVKLTVSGLDPKTRYWWCFEVDSALDAEPRGSFKTAPTSGWGSFSFGAAACAGNEHADYGIVEFRDTSDAPTFDFIRARQPDLFVHMGDFHYRDVASNDVLLTRQALRDVLGNPKQKALWHSTNLAYVWDDHDYTGMTNGDSTATAKPAALTAYKQSMPHYPLGVAGDVDAAPIGQTFTYGPARFVLLDVRSQRDHSTSPPTMLGDDQLAWLQSVLAATTERVLFLVAVSPWIDDTDIGGDPWGGFIEERTQILDWLETYSLTDKTIILAGDMHACAWDDGTNNDYATSGDPGPPVFQFAAMDCGTSTKGGPYTSGTFSTLKQQYGFIQVNDSAEELEVVLSAYGLAVDGESESQLFTTTLTFEGAPQPDPMLRFATLAHPAADVVLTATAGV